MKYTKKIPSEVEEEIKKLGKGEVFEWKDPITGITLIHKKSKSNGSKLKVSDLGISIPNNPTAEVVLFRFFNNSGLFIEDVVAEDFISAGITTITDEDGQTSVEKYDNGTSMKFNRGYLTKLVRMDGDGHQYIAIIEHPSLKENKKVVVEIL